MGAIRQPIEVAIAEAPSIGFIGLDGTRVQAKAITTRDRVDKTSAIQTIRCKPCRSGGQVGPVLNLPRDKSRKKHGRECDAGPERPQAVPRKRDPSKRRGDACTH